MNKVLRLFRIINRSTDSLSAHPPALGRTRADEPSAPRSRVSTRCTLVLLASLLLGDDLRAEATSDIVTTNRPITLQECIDLALQENLDLKIERINPRLSILDLDAVRGGYDPLLNFSATHTYSESGGGLDTQSRSVPANTSDSHSLSSGISGLGPMGFGYNLSARATESYGNRPFLNTNGQSIPGLFDTTSGNVGISLTQPLLKNFWIDGTRYNIAIARNRIKNSGWKVQEQIIAIVTQVEQAYNELNATKQSVKVQQDALRLADQLAQENKKKSEIGEKARLDPEVLQSQSQAKARQADLAAANGSLATARNNLRKLITSRFSELRAADLDPVDPLVALPYVLDLQESWRTGLSERPDLKQARLEVERQGITVRYSRNQMLPELDLTGGFGHGAGGSTVREFSDGFSDFRRGNHPNWTIGATFSVPLGNRTARANYRKNKETAEQLLLTLKKQEETALVEIDDAITKIRTSRERIESTREAREIGEKVLAGEEQNYRVGKTVSYNVNLRQQELTAARSEEIRALVDYNKAITDLSKAEGTTLKRRNIDVEIR